MREILYLLPHDHQPVDCHRWAQEEVAWAFRDAPGDMSVPSAMGRMMEGGVRAVGADILEDPMLALEQATARFEAQEKFGKFKKAVLAIGPDHARALEKVYSDPLEESDLLAFGGAANLFPESQKAHEAHQRSRTSLGFIAWAGQFRVKLAGERYPDTRVSGRWLRREPVASDADKAIAADIRREMEKKLIAALAEYVQARPRRFETLQDQVRRKGR